LVIFADKEKRQVTADFKSKAANSPFVGEELTGSVKYTICDGEIVYQA
ncbi:MAG: dihydroorotase, partial [Streptococcus sp.]